MSNEQDISLAEKKNFSLEKPNEGLGLLGLASLNLPNNSMIIPPLNWTMVSARVFRSGYPIACNFRFLEGLRLRSILCLCPENLKTESENWARSIGVKLYQLSIGDNNEPFVSMDRFAVAEALRLLSDPNEQPILVHCMSGKNRTGCVIGCLRRLQGWSLSAIFDEYSRFSGTSGTILDCQFIELWDFKS